MSQYKRDYSRGTYLIFNMPFAVYVGGRAMCSDGKVRSLKRIAETADTFFSVPASIVVKGKTVAGYVTTETEEGLSTDTKADPACIKFCAYTYGRNGHLLPIGSWKRVQS